MTSHEVEAVEVEAQPIALMNAAERAEIDQLITTARAFPRSVTQFKAKTMQMCVLDEETADECFYSLPRGGKTLQGPSVRMAELVLSAWGNSRAGARIVDEGPEFITAQGVFHDLETNVQITMEVRRSITSNRGRFNQDMIGVTGNAACSIALRNVVFRGVPKALWAPCYQATVQCSVGDVDSLANRRDKAMRYLQDLSVEPDRVFVRLGVAGVEDITVKHLADLKGYVNAVRNGETTPEDAFPLIVVESDRPAPAAKGAAGLSERAQGGSGE